MDSIYKNDKDREINKPETIDFSIKTKGLYLVKISARVKGEKQLGGTDDEDLKIEIDKKKFTQPAAFSGGNLHNLKKTTFFALPFDSGKHTISLIPDISATLLAVQISKIDEDSNLNLVLDDKAEDGDRRPWITFVLVDLSLDKFKTELILKRRFIDSDDVKVIINDKIERNNQSKLHKLWYFITSLFTGEIQTETFIVNLSKNTHYIEFWADRMPTMQKIIFEFGENNQKRIPTVGDPEWTGDFNDDPENILLARLIFGEAENQPKEAKIGVGFTIINRVKKQRSNWGLNLKEVILKQNAYDALWNLDRRDKARDPLNNSSPATKDAWNQSYDIAIGILDNSLSDPTSGATNFHSFTDKENFPFWASDENFKVKIGDLYFYELES